MWLTVASSRLQQQKQQLSRLHFQPTTVAGPGFADSNSLSFGLHPASFVFNTFPALSALVAADWKSSHGQHIGPLLCPLQLHKPKFHYATLF